MKYTRYDLKKKKNNTPIFILIIVIILILAYVSGTIISSLIIKDRDKVKENSVKVGQVVKKDIKNIKIDKFIGIQCGVFKNKTNAETVKNNIVSFGNPFIINENNNNKVILGIYTDTKASMISKTLKDKNIEFSKINFDFKLNGLCDQQIVEVIDAYLQIINKLENPNVKSVQTKQLKEWALKLKPISKEEINFGILNEIKEDIKKLPVKICKEDCGKYNTYIYIKLKELK